MGSIKAKNVCVDPTSASKRTTMIKLFLIALLCVVVFADKSPAENMNDGWMGPAKAMADMAQHAMGQGSSLVRRAAQMTAQRQQGPPPPPGGSGGPQGQSSE